VVLALITLHHAKETDFSKNGFGVLDSVIFNDSGKWEMNGEFIISFEIPAMTEYTHLLVNRNIIQAPVPFMDRQLFRIYRIEKTLQSIYVEARHIFYDLLDNWVEDTNIVSKVGNDAIQQLLSNTQYPHSFIATSNIDTSASARIVRMNPVAALLDDGKNNSFLRRWGGELVRNNYHIEMLERMGSDRGIKIEHKRDLMGYSATFDVSTIVTRIHPVGFDGLELPEKYVDSQSIDLDHPIISEVKYDDIKAAVGEYTEDEDAVPLEQAYNMLREAAQNEFEQNHVDEPETVVNVDFVALHNTEQYKHFKQLQEVKAGDTVKVAVYDHAFEITSRLVAFDFSLLKENHYTSTTLGNHVYEFTSSGVDVSELRQRVEQAEQSAVNAMQAANGRNRNFFGTDDPNTIQLNARVGDLFFREEGERKWMYRYVEVNGERYWKIETDSEEFDQVKNNIEEQQLAIQEAQDSADAANQQINDAIQNAGFSTLADLTADIQSISNRADANALTAIDNASVAMTNALTALDNISGLETTVQNINVDIDQINGTLDLKADRQTVDALSGIVQNHTFDIQANADGLALKADSSVVDTLTGNVNTLSTEVGLIAGELSSKISQTQLQSAIDDIEVGGRNLLRNTNPEWVELTLDSGQTLTYVHPEAELEQDSTYTFTIEYETNDAIIDVQVGAGLLGYEQDIIGWNATNIPSNQRVSLTHKVLESELIKGTTTDSFSIDDDFYLDSAMIVSNQSNPLYSASGMVAPPIGGVFNNIQRDGVIPAGRRRIDFPPLHNTIIVLLDYYAMTKDIRYLNQAKLIADYILTLEFQANFAGQRIALVAGTNMWNGTTWVLGKSEIGLRIVYNAINVMTLMYEQTKDERYSTLAKKLMITATTANGNVNNRISWGELGRHMSGALYDHIYVNEDNNNASFSWARFNPNNADALVEAYHNYIRVFRDTEVTTVDNNRIKPSVVVDEFAKWILAINARGELTMAPTGLPYIFYDYPVGGTNWDWVSGNNERGDVWFTGDAVLWLIKGLSLISNDYPQIKQLAETYFNNLYKLKATSHPELGSLANQVLFLDRYNFDGTLLEHDMALSISSTALFWEVGQTLNLITPNLERDLINTLKVNYPKRIGNKDVDGAYSWDSVDPQNSWIELKANGEIYHALLTCYFAKSESRNIFGYKITNKGPKSTIRYRRQQLEHGNISTDWAPAPEDTVQLISNVETEWRQTAQGFAQDITRVETGLDGKASLAAFNTLTSTVDGTIQRIGDAEGNITQIEADVSGLQTTVASKASQTEVTQLANGYNVLSTSFNNLEIGGRNLLIRSTETNATMINVSGQVDSAINHSTSDYIPVKPNTDYMFTKSDSNLATDAGFFRWAWYDEDKNYISRSPDSRNEFLWTVPANAHFVRISYPDDSYPKFEKGNKATDWTPAPEDMASQAQFTVLNNAITAKVSKGDVYSQLLVDARNILFDANDKIIMSAPTVVFSGSAFIPSAAIESLSADKLTAGTIDANNINVINMNVNSLVGNTSEFIRSGWNSAAGGTVSISGSGISSHAPDNSQVYIQNGIMGVRNPSGATLGHIGYHWETDRAFYHIQTSLGTNFAISARIGNSSSSVRRTMLDIFPGSSETYVRTNEFRHVGATGDTTLPTARFSGRVLLDDELRLADGNIVNPYGIYFNNGGSIYSLSSNSHLRIDAGTSLYLRTSNTNTALWFDNTHAYMIRTLSMEGNNITNQSDERLKTNIIEHEQSSLERIKAFNFVDFTWIKNGREDFGLIAQEVQQIAPELISENEGILSINNTLLNMMTTHAIQELSKEHENTLLVASHAYLLAEQHEDELACYKKRIEELEEKVKRLEGAA